MSMTVAGASGAWSGAKTGASTRMSPQQKYSNVFDQIDTAGSGTITKSQFEQAFSSLKMPPSFRRAGADSVFSQLDPNGTGSASKQNFVSGMIDQMKAMRASRAQSAPSSDGDADFDALVKSLSSSAGNAGTTAEAATGAAGTTLDVTV